MCRSPRAVWPIVALVFVCGSSRVSAAEPPTRTIEVSAAGTILVEPDEVLLTLKAHTQNKDLLPAKSENDRITRTVLALREKYGVSEEHFQIDDFRIRPEYERPEQGAEMRFVGYSVHRSIQITLKDFTTMEPLLSDALAAGITRLDEILYRTTKHREYQFEARQLAVEIAREKAGHLAEMNGLKLGKPISIEHRLEGGRHTGRMFSMLRRSPVADSGHVKVRPASMTSAIPKTPHRSDKAPAELQPIAPGLLSIQCTVEITFEMIE